MVQTSLKHQENPSEYLIYSPLLHIKQTYRPPCISMAILTSTVITRQEIPWFTIPGSSISYMSCCSVKCTCYIVYSHHKRSHNTQSLGPALVICSLVAVCMNIEHDLSSSQEIPWYTIPGSPPATCCSVHDVLWQLIPPETGDLERSAATMLQRSDARVWVVLVLVSDDDITPTLW